MSDPFYRAFEDRHRGSRESIQERQGSYLPFLRALRESEAAPVLVDLGCGRGEWLALARDEGWGVHGVDLDDEMLQDCRDRGLDVRQGDALAYLRTLADASVNVVSGFHVAEHLPFEQVRSLAAESLRVLRPGGLLVLETPNPENLVVGSSAFHMDPTHVRPLPPALLAFVAEYAGFERVTTLRLHEGVRAQTPIHLIDVLAGVSPDYAIVAVKPGGTPSPALDGLLSATRGVTLNDLAERYDSRLGSRLREVEVAAAMAREQATQLIARIEAVERVNAAWIDFDHKAVDRVFQLQEQVSAMENSTSWRVSAPVRWLGAQRMALRQRGPRSAVRALLVLPVHLADRLLKKVPAVRAPLVRIARAIGLRPPARPANAVPGVPAAPDRDTMTEEARRVHDALRQAVAAAPRKDR